MKTKDIEIDWEDPKTNDIRKEIITIKELTYGEDNDLTEKMMQIKVLGKETLTHISYKSMAEESLVVAITKAPFPITIESIRALPKKLGEMLYKEIDAMNDITPEEKKNSNTPSPEKVVPEKPSAE